MYEKPQPILFPPQLEPRLESSRGRFGPSQGLPLLSIWRLYFLRDVKMANEVKVPLIILNSLMIVGLGLGGFVLKGMQDVERRLTVIETKMEMQKYVNVPKNP